MTGIYFDRVIEWINITSQSETGNKTDVMQPRVPETPGDADLLQGNNDSTGSERVLAELVKM